MMTYERLAEIRLRVNREERIGSQAEEDRHHLLAEVDRLRAAPGPDPAEERRLADIRQRIALAAKGSRYAPSPVNYAADVAYLLARLAAAHGVLDDLLSDDDAPEGRGLWRAGAAAERRRVLAVLADRRRYAVQEEDRHRLAWLVAAVEALPPLPPPLAAEQARIRQGRLGAALRRVMELYEVAEDDGYWAHAAEKMAECARDALGAEGGA